MILVICSKRGKNRNYLPYIIICIFGYFFICIKFIVSKNYLNFDSFTDNSLLSTALNGKNAQY